MGSEHPLLSQGATEEFNTVGKVEKTLCSLFHLAHPCKWHTNPENGKCQTSRDQKKAPGILMPQGPMLSWVLGPFPIILILEESWSLVGTRSTHSTPADYFAGHLVSSMSETVTT